MAISDTRPITAFASGKTMRLSIVWSDLLDLKARAEATIIVNVELNRSRLCHNCCCLRQGVKWARGFAIRAPDPPEGFGLPE